MSKRPGADPPPNPKRHRLPSGSQLSKDKHNITESVSVTATIKMSSKLVSLVEALREAVSTLQKRREKLGADAEDADQLMQVKEVYVAMLKVIVTKWAILDDSPNIIQNKTVTIQGKEITNANDGYPRIDQTCKFFEEQGFKEDPAYVFDRAVALYKLRRETLQWNRVDVDGQVKSYMEDQRKDPSFDLAEDKAARAAEYIKECVAKKGKLYKEINDIHEYLDELNLLMVPERSCQISNAMETSELLYELKAVYVDLAQCNALKKLENKFRYGKAIFSFTELRQLKLAFIPHTTFIEARLKTAETIYRNLQGSGKLGSEAAKGKAELESHLRKYAPASRVVEDDIETAISQVTKAVAEGTEKTSGSKGGEGSGQA